MRLLVTKKIVSVAVLTSVVIAFTLGCGFLMGYNVARTGNIEEILVNAQVDDTMTTVNMEKAGIYEPSIDIVFSMYAF